MLRSAKELTGFKLGAIDGDIGEVSDLFFDESRWTIRYLVADTGTWLADKLVLISPYSLAPASDEDRRVPVSLNREQIETSPDVDSAPDVSRQQEMLFSNHYGWPHYWQGGGVWASGAFPSIHITDETGMPLEQPDADPGLHSIKEVTGYNIQASDDEMGHVEDFIVDDESWRIRYMVVDTNVWWLGKHVLVSPEWVEEVVWNERRVRVDLSRDQIKNAPEWDGTSPLDREYEERLHKAYGKAFRVF